MQGCLACFRSSQLHSRCVFCLQVFVKGLLDKFKVQPEVFRREEYKVRSTVELSGGLEHLACIITLHKLCHLPVMAPCLRCCPDAMHAPGDSPSTLHTVPCCAAAHLQSALAPLTGTGYDAAHRQNLEELLGVRQHSVQLCAQLQITAHGVRQLHSSRLRPVQCAEGNKLLRRLAGLICCMHNAAALALYCLARLCRAIQSATYCYCHQSQSIVRHSMSNVVSAVIYCRLQSLYDQVVQGIASARRLTPEAVKAAVNSSPLLPSQAMQAKLLDGLAYRWGTHTSNFRHGFKVTGCTSLHLLERADRQTHGVIQKTMCGSDLLLTITAETRLKGTCCSSCQQMCGKLTSSPCSPAVGSLLQQHTGQSS